MKRGRNAIYDKFPVVSLRSTTGYWQASLRDAARRLPPIREAGGFVACSRWLRSEATTPPDNDTLISHCCVATHPRSLRLHDTTTHPPISKTIVEILKPKTSTAIHGEEESTAYYVRGSLKPIINRT